MNGPGPTSNSSSVEPDSPPGQSAATGLVPNPYAGNTDLFQGHLLEQYKLAVEMAAQLSAMRQSANNFYISILSAFAVLYSLLEKVPSAAARDALQYGLPIVAMALCIMWGLLITSYRRINAAKYTVILELETKLPVAPYTREWQHLEDGKRRHHHLTQVEAAVPVLFGLAFGLLLLKSILAPGS